MTKTILLLFIFFNQFNFAQYNSLRVGGIVIELGAEYDYAINLFKESGILTKEIVSSASNRFYYLYRANDESNLIGSISFNNGKIISIQKFWGPYKLEDRNLNYLNDYFEILKSFNNKENNSLLTATENYEPDFKVKSIKFSNGNKIVDLDFTQMEIHLTERIEQ